MLGTDLSESPATQNACMGCAGVPGSSYLSALHTAWGPKEARFVPLNWRSSCQLVGWPVSKAMQLEEIVADTSR